MKTPIIAALFLATLAFVIPSEAVTIPTVLIGNPGNPFDTRYTNSDHPNLGSVAYAYSIGKTEVTNAQYVAFLNAVAAADPFGLYNTDMANSSIGGIIRSGASGSFIYSVKTSALQGTYTYGNKPVSFVGWADAARFANWLHNGQPTGAEDATTTEDGAYTLNGETSTTALAAISRNSAARWMLPNENEWYKAAYYNSATASYYDYPTSTNSAPNNNKPSSDTGNSANYFNPSTGGFTTGDSFHPFTDTGAYTLSVSPYGTFDQGGNAKEWNETRFGSDNNFPGIRGGSTNDPLQNLNAKSYSFNTPGGDSATGFRIAMSEVPEPSAVVLSALAIVALAYRRGRPPNYR
jgi:formylglycine-generating enzyme required for sulfatase activity